MIILIWKARAKKFRRWLEMAVKPARARDFGSTATRPSAPPFWDLRKQRSDNVIGYKTLSSATVVFHRETTCRQHRQALLHHFDSIITRKQSRTSRATHTREILIYISIPIFPSSTYPTRFNSQTTLFLLAFSKARLIAGTFSFRGERALSFLPFGSAINKQDWWSLDTSFRTTAGGLHLMHLNSTLLDSYFLLTYADLYFLIGTYSPARRLRCEAKSLRFRKLYT